MFTDEILEKILLSKDMKDVPIKHQSDCIHAIEKALEECGYDFRERERTNSKNQHS